MIVKMTIIRLLGSSDDKEKEKEKIGVARPKGVEGEPPLAGVEGGPPLTGLRAAP